MEVKQFITEIQSKGFYVNYGIIPRGTRHWMTIFDPHYNLIYKFPVDREYKWEYKIEYCGEVYERNKILYLPEIIERFGGNKVNIPTPQYVNIKTKLELIESLLKDKKFLEYVDHFTGIAYYVSHGSGGGSELVFKNELVYLHGEKFNFGKSHPFLGPNFESISLITKLQKLPENKWHELLKDIGEIKLPEYDKLREYNYSSNNDIFKGDKFIAKALRTDSFDNHLTGEARVIYTYPDCKFEVYDLIRVNVNKSSIEFTKVYK